MILASTVRKLAQQGATIYRVDIPAQDVQGIKFPGMSEYFATKQAAQMAIDGYPLKGATVTPELCTMEKHYMLT